MPSKHPIFDVSRLKLQPLARREHLMSLADVLPLGQAAGPFEHPALPVLADRILAAKQRGSAVVLMLGAHVVKEGLSRYVIDLMRRKLVDVVAVNGAVSIHDFELSLIGATSEPVARYIRTGEFGMWRETAAICDVIADGHRQGLGYGEALGRHILEKHPHKDVSILAAGYELGVPVTVHVGIGYDIIHQLPNFDGCSFGGCSARDFLIYTKAIENLEGGAMLCFGSAVMGPEVYLKALSMARNVARQQRRQIAHFTTAVFDLIQLPDDLTQTPGKDQPAYYYRPLKTILIRTISDGGESFYIQGGHRHTLPALHKQIVSKMK
jgi:hypothetical protein